MNWAINLALGSQSTNSSTINFCSNTLHSRDRTKIMINLSMLTTARKVHQIVYLWHESTACFPYITPLCARGHQIKLSLSIFIIFISEFWNTNRLTTFSTKTIENEKFSMLFGGNSTTAAVSSLMAQYQFHGMFTRYICQIWMREAQIQLSSESIATEHISNVSSYLLFVYTEKFLTLVCVFVVLFGERKKFEIKTGYTHDLLVYDIEVLVDDKMMC